MIQLVLQEDLNEDAWNKVVRKHGQGRPFAFSWFLDTVCDHWDALVLNDYEAVLPLPHYFKMGQKWGVMPPWTFQLGVIGPEVHESLLSDFILSIPKEYGLVQWILNQSNSPEITSKNQKTYQWKCGPGESPSQTLRANPEYLKREFDYSVFRNDPPEALIELLINQQNPKHLFDAASLERLKHLMHVGQHKRKGQVWSLYDKSNTLAAGAYIFYDADRITLHTLAGRSEDNDHWPETILVQAIIAETEPFPVLLEVDEKILPKFLTERLSPEVFSVPVIEINRLPWYLKWYRPAL